MRLATMTDDETLAVAAPLDEAGLGALRTERGNLPLDRLDVRAEITGLVARTDLTQEFVNVHAQPLEATYIFPLPDRAAVVRMAMTADGRVVEAELRERGAAREAYDTAIAAGQRASIAEEERPDVFTMRVGNILPGERVSVRLSLVGPLAFEDGEATYRFPLVVAPRYIPGAPLDGDSVGDGYALDTDAVPDASRITPPVLLPGFPNPLRLSIDVTVDPAGLPLGDVRSSLHAVSKTENQVSVLPGERANRDFVLRLAYGPGAQSLALAPDAEGDEGTYRLTVLPPADDTVTIARPKDVVLLLDRSGSMAGWKMVAARRAAARIIDTLGVQDRFAVLAFDDRVETPESLGEGLCTGTDRNRYRAVEHLARMDARGGTELLQPLLDGLRLLHTAANGNPDSDRTRARARDAGSDSDSDSDGNRISRGDVDGDSDGVGVGVSDMAGRGDSGRVGRGDSGRVGGTDSGRVGGTDRGSAQHATGRRDGAGERDRDRVLVLVTDGQVGNEDQILRTVSAALRGVRVHTVGIDQAINAGFLGRLAIAGGGRCELVESEDRLDEAMDRIHRRIGAPVVIGVTVTAEGLELLDDTRTPARLPDVFPGVPYIVTGRYRGDLAGALTVAGTTRDGKPWSASVPAARHDSTALTPMWARALLRDLEDRYVARTHGSAELESRITDISLRFGVLCRFTAFVAVDSRIVTEGGERRKVTQPVESPAGWEMPTAVPAPPLHPVAYAASMAPPRAAAPGGAPMPPSPAAMPPMAAPRPASTGAMPFPAGGVGGGGVLRKARGRGSARMVMPVQAQAHEAHASDAEVRELAAQEAARLRAAGERPEFERRELLEDLGSRLAALAVPQLRELTEALTPQAIVARPFAELWQFVLDALDRAAGNRVAGDRTAGERAGQEQAKPARGAFWKR